LWVFLYMGVLCKSDGLNIQVVGSSSNYELGKVTVICSGGGTDVQLFRRLGSSIDSVEVDDNLLVTGFTFKLNQTVEGYYYCVDLSTNTNSSEVELAGKKMFLDFSSLHRGL